MSWYGWLSLAVAVIGSVWGWRVVFRAVAADCAGRAPDWSDVVAAILLASITFWGWPLIAVFGLARMVVAPHDAAEFARKVGGESREAKRRRREKELRAREEWIARKERELGIT